MPRLTLSQRILAALPQLRPPPEPEPESVRRARRAAGSSAAAGARRGTAPATDSAGSAGAAGTAAPADTATSTGTPAPGGSLRRRLRAAMIEPAAEQSSGRPAHTDELAEVPSSELVRRIKELDDRERLFALFTAPLGAAVAAMVTALALVYNPATGKNHASPGLILLEGGVRLLLAVVVLVAALVRRRSLVSWSMLFLGTSMGFPLALPFFGIGGWMIWRTYKIQRVLSTRPDAPDRYRRRAAPARRAAAPRSPRDGAARGAAAGRKAFTRRGTSAPPSGPAPSKRYTPPSPKRPRPSASG